MEGGHPVTEAEAVLPPFPVDEATLELLEAAMDPWGHGGDPDAVKSSLWDFLQLMSQMGGSDPRAVEEVVDGIYLMRDPLYTDHCVISALIGEVRRLRVALAEAGGG